MTPRFGTLIVSATLAALATACAPVPRPAILGDLEAVRGGASAEEARSYAPAAFAHAEKLRREAHAAFTAGDLAGAQLIGERAAAAYAHAQALARIARAEAGTSDAEAGLTASREDLGLLEAEQTRASAEALALELRVRVARDAMPVQPSGRADPDRERARLAAARSLALDARLLCTAARLLADAPAAPGPPIDPKLVVQVDEAAAALAKLDAQLAPAPAVTPIDEAARARAGCLAALTAIRRAATPLTKAPGAGDALLSQISAAGGFAPSRDDRGVFVTLRNVFRGDKLAPAAEARLAELGKIAGAHASFPAIIVLHADKPVGARDDAAHRARVGTVTKALSAAGSAVRVASVVAGNAAPLVDPAGADKARNARVEIVFVTPESF